jgi:phosphoribosyl-ATP pyrophosphohydrolase/phosphoribosyl-AMP cyclohydrolase
MPTNDPLIPVVTQDVKTNNVLMLAYVNKLALRMTKKTGFMHYWSRSRNKLWKKGEESGHLQKVVSLHYDCDRDTILARVHQTGPACHNMTYTCFTDKVFKAQDILETLAQVFRDRKRAPKKGSYTNAMLKDRDQLLKKLGEESAELIVACKNRKKDRVTSEAADLVYHLLLALFAHGVTLDDVKAELERRHR